MGSTLELTEKQAQERKKTMYDITPPDKVMFPLDWLAGGDFDDDGFYICNVLEYIAAEASPKIRRVICLFAFEGVKVPDEVIEEGLLIVGQTILEVRKVCQELTKNRFGMGGHDVYLRDEDWPLLVKKLERRPQVGWFQQWSVL